jgi:GDP-4-dehydro-6-deoxy-D-mannose reductase
MKALISGITGCSGSHLAEYLISEGHSVAGIRRESSSFANISHLTDRIEIIEVDFNEDESLAGAIKSLKPDCIFWLAAANQFHEMGGIYQTNVQTTLCFFESLLKVKFRGRVVIASSSAVYGIRQENRIIAENDKLLCSGHYGLSKVFQERIADYYYRNHELDVIITRPFNFAGPREYPSYVCSSFTRQIVQIERGEIAPVLKVGNLDSIRDFTDVRDVARGYAMIADDGSKGEVYNICSGKGVSIRTILDKLLSLSTPGIKVESDQGGISDLRPNIQVGDPSKIFRTTGWKAEIPLDKTLEDMLTYYRTTGI